MNILGFDILTLLLLLPLIFAALTYVGSKINRKGVNNKQLVWIISTIGSLIVFILSLILLYNYIIGDAGVDISESRIYFEVKYQWIPALNLNYHLGVDGFSIYFIVLTALLVPICLIISFKSIKDRVGEFAMLFLLMESCVIGIFCALDVFLFYVFFEAVLIPMFLIIGIWGGENRIYATFKFFLYTFFGSVFMLIALIWIYVNTNTAAIFELYEVLPTYGLLVQQLLFLAFFISFAIKVPMWPFHTWLPDAHVQAPTAGSVILAGILLKLGGYGFLRFSLPMLPDASLYFADVIIILSIAAVIITSIIAIMQTDMKKLIAYSSVAHMGFVTAGIFSFNYEAVSGAIFQMISHGLISAALFICVGVLYDRMKTKKISEYGGVTSVMPRFAMMFMLFTLASVGLPGTSGFIGEFITLAGIFQYSKLYATLVALGIVLGAAYMLYLYKNVMYGAISNTKIKKLQDLDLQEKAVLYILGVGVLLLGVYPYMISLVTDNAAYFINHLYIK